MSEQTNRTEQSAISPQELRQRMLEELDASKQAIEELSDEELEDVAGGSLVNLGRIVYSVARNAARDGGNAAAKYGKEFWNSQVSKSGAAVLSASGVGVGISNSK